MIGDILKDCSYHKIQKGERKYDCLVDQGRIYMAESLATLSNKCAVIFITRPIFSAVKITYHAVRLFIDPFVAITLKVSSFAKHVFIEKNEFASIAFRTELQNCFVEILFQSCNHIYEMIRAPYYMISIMYYALYGAFDNPIEARRLIAEAERNQYSPNVTRKDDWFKGDKKRVKPWYESHVVFQAICFQPYGEIQNYPDAVKSSIPEYIGKFSSSLLVFKALFSGELFASPQGNKASDL